MASYFDPLKRTDLVLYAKPKKDPVLSPWDDDVVVFEPVEEGLPGDYEANTDDSLEYVVYLQAGADPASSDTPIGKVDIVSDGSNGFLINLTIKSSTGVVIPACEVVITTSSTSSITDVLKSSGTNDQGKVDFRLNTGTYYLWRNKARYQFTDPLTLVVSSNGTFTLS